jgi:hypothetical protein
LTGPFREMLAGAGHRKSPVGEALPVGLHSQSFPTRSWRWRGTWVRDILPQPHDPYQATITPRHPNCRSGHTRLRITLPCLRHGPLPIWCCASRPTGPERACRARFLGIKPSSALSGNRVAHPRILQEIRGDTAEMNQHAMQAAQPPAGMTRVYVIGVHHHRLHAGRPVHGCPLCHCQCTRARRNAGTAPGIPRQ